MPVAFLFVYPGNETRLARQNYCITHGVHLVSLSNQRTWVGALLVLFTANCASPVLDILLQTASFVNFSVQ